MKSIMYIFFVLYVVIVFQPSMVSAQSPHQREVLTEEQFLNASEAKRSEVLSNPGTYIVVKDGQKVDVWSKQEVRDGADMKPEGDKISRTDRSKQEKGNNEIIEKAIEAGVVNSAEDIKRKDPESLEQLKERVAEKNRVARQEAGSELRKNTRTVHPDEAIVPNSSTRTVVHSEDFDPSLVQDGHSDEEGMTDADRDVNSVKGASSNSAEPPVWLSTDNMTEAQKQFLFSGEGSLTEKEYSRLSDGEKSEYVRTRRSVR